MKKHLAVAALGLVVLSNTGCAVLMRYVGDFAAMLITQKTADLSLLSANVTLTSNLLPVQSGLVDAEASGASWKEGEAMLAVTFLKRSGIGMYEVDGTVSSRSGKQTRPMTYLGKGTYVEPLSAKELSARSIIVQAGNRSAEFQLSPVGAIAIRAINGKAPRGATLDLTKDLILDLNLPAGQTSLPVKVSVIAQALGIKTLGDLGIFKASSQLRIPKQVFANMQLSAGQDVGAVGIPTGDNYLVVERYQASTPKVAGIGAAQLIGRHWAWAPVKVVGSTPLNTGLEVNGKRPGSTSDVLYTARKPNAFYGPPLNQAKAIALGSLRAKGCLYKKSTTSDSQTYGSSGLTYTVTTKTTKTLKFPELPDAYWQTMLAQLEAGLGGVLQRVASVELMPMARLQSSATYQAMDTVQAETNQMGAGDNESTSVVKPYRESKWVIPESFGSVMTGMSSTFPADRPISRMLREADLDAVLSVSLDVQIATLAKSDKLVLVPSLNYGLYGRANGYVVGPTCYVQGSVTTTDGVPFNAAQLKADPSELARVVRMPELLEALEQALLELRSHEQRAGYHAIWDLR